MQVRILSVCLQFVLFLLARCPSRGATRKDFGILRLARDWTCDFHLPELHQNSPYQFPLDVDVSTRMCDGFIVSRSKKIVIPLELTVPMEENIERWHQEKTERYSNLTCPGWQSHLLVFEVGCRGFIPARFPSSLRMLGFNSSETRTNWWHESAAMLSGLIDLTRILTQLFGSWWMVFLSQMLMH